MTKSVISAADFRDRAVRIIPIPGFSDKDEPIHIKIRSTGVMNLVSSGRIPNTLLGKVTQLFGETETVAKDSVKLNDITDSQKKDALNKLNGSENGLNDMAALMKVFAEATMVEPTYAEIGEYMTDAQLMAVFGAIYGEVQEAESFRNDKGNE